jgi:spore coat assembly protein SafA
MQVYMVVKGDTLWMIAKKFGISLEEIIKANPQIKDPNKIFSGDEVNIPLPVTDGKSVYTAQSGDTMWSIAKKFGISLDALLAVNPQITDADVIQLGQKIYIPLQSVSADYRMVYTVQAGDTLWKIAQKYGISAEALMKANPKLKHADQIYPGQTIQVPLPVAANAMVGVNNGALYFVKKGDTIFNISQRYALNPETLLVANPQISDANRLNPGMQLYLPGFHYVRSGETFYSIAAHYQVELESLIAVNPQINDTDAISVGQKITIPRQKCGDIATYTVKQGDTIYKIAQKYNVPVEALLNANRDIVSAELIYPGEKLQVPGPHLVQRGQTLFGIANLYGVSLEALRAANPNITDPDQIAPQTMILIPPAEMNSCRGGESFGIDYKVLNNNDLTSIAELYHISLKELIDYNPDLSDSDHLRSGTVVHVPTGYVESVSYVVQPRDTVYQIARMYQVPADHIVRANPQIVNADDIDPGMVLMIPIRNKSCEKCDVKKRETDRRRDVTYPEIYVVQKGDTLYSIASRFKSTVKQLRMANAAVKDGDTVYPGQQLIILPTDFISDYRCLNCPWLEQGIEE